MCHTGSPEGFRAGIVTGSPASLGAAARSASATAAGDGSRNHLIATPYSPPGDQDNWPMGPAPVRFSFDGLPLEAPRGMTVGGALLANRIVSWRRTSVQGRPRGSSAGAGGCFDCLVDVGERHAVRACLILVRDGDEGRTSSARGGAG